MPVPPGGTRGRRSLVRKVEGLMLREHLFPAGSRALVMVSGGQDSLALLHILVNGRRREGRPDHLHVLHINHHLRGGESDADEALVIRACAAMGVSIAVIHRPIDKARGNVQEQARDVRREVAIATAAELGCDRIVLGHTADDQVETMLYRLGRYGGTAAFGGMRVCDPPWVRPLLECRRRETGSYCEEHGLEFACDRGNTYPGYARTAIRQQVVPAWETALPGAVEAACRAAEVAGEMRELAAAAIQGAAAGVVAGEPDGGEGVLLERAGCLSASALLALDAPLRRLLLHAWLEGRARPAASRAGVLAVEALLAVPGSAQRALSGRIGVVKEYDRVFLVRRAGAGQGTGIVTGVPAAVPLPVGGSVGWCDGVITAERVAAFCMPDVSRETFVDGAMLSGPLEVRAPRPGDRLRPFGSSGSRKLQDIFVDLRIPARERSTWPLVVSGERIVWVCGLVSAEEGRIGPNTDEIIRFTWERV